MFAAAILLGIAPDVGSAEAQARIDIAQPGDVVYIEQAAYADPLFIDKPLVVIGRNKPTIDLRLAGRGYGTVTMTGFNFGDVGGGGFDAVKLIDCHVSQKFSLSSVGYIEFERVIVDNCHGNPIDAPGAVVLLADSSVASKVSNIGTPNGIVTCRDLYLAGTPRRGLYNVDVLHELPDDLSIDRTHGGRGSFRLSWSGSPGPIVALYMSLGSKPPQDIPSARMGFDFLASPLFVGWIRTPGEIVVDVPAELIGTELAFQYWDPPRYYSRPAFFLVH